MTNTDNPIPVDPEMAAAVAIAKTAALLNVTKGQLVPSPTAPSSRQPPTFMVSPETVLVQGEVAIGTPQLLQSRKENIPAIKERLAFLERNIIGISTKAVAESKEITILADKTIPFSALKKIMSTCTSSGYGKISLAVIQKATQS